MAGKEIWVQAKPEKASMHEVGVGRLQPGSPQLFSGLRNNVPEISVFLSCHWWQGAGAEKKGAISGGGLGASIPCFWRLNTLGPQGLSKAGFWPGGTDEGKL